MEEEDRAREHGGLCHRGEALGEVDASVAQCREADASGSEHARKGEHPTDGLARLHGYAST
jgi:hypothetical protein